MQDDAPTAPLRPATENAPPPRHSWRKPCPSLLDVRRNKVLHHVSTLLDKICMLRLETPDPQVITPLASFTGTKFAIAKMGHNATHARARLNQVYTCIVVAVQTFLIKPEPYRFTVCWYCTVTPFHSTENMANRHIHTPHTTHTTHTHTRARACAPVWSNARVHCSRLRRKGKKECKESTPQPLDSQKLLAPERIPGLAMLRAQEHTPKRPAVLSCPSTEDGKTCRA